MWRITLTGGRHHGRPDGSSLEVVECSQSGRSAGRRASRRRLSAGVPSEFEAAMATSRRCWRWSWRGAWYRSGWPRHRGDQRRRQRGRDHREQRVQALYAGVTAPAPCLAEQPQKGAQRRRRRMSVNNRGMPPWRSRSRSSIESAPQTMPATTAAVFAAALTPPFAAIFTCSPSRAGSPHRRANAMTGTGPAHATDSDRRTVR